MQKGGVSFGSGPVNTSQTVLSPRNLTVLLKQARDAKLTPYYSLINVVCMNAGIICGIVQRCPGL